jgi:superfamily I DNA/RNA helicase
VSETFVIDGPPGCGKTRFLSRQSQRAVERHGGNAVAIASLTRAAAAEIASRADGQIPDENVGTLHAHCYRALDRPDLAETAKSLREFSSAHPANTLTGGITDPDDAPTDEGASGTHADELHNAVAIHRARMTPREKWTPEQQDHDALWQGFKRETGRLDFTDLIEHCLHDNSPHHAHPRVLLLDEAQDFSRLELALARQWATHADTTVIVGDPRQAIYSWRGADPDGLITLPATDRRVLSQSHRVPRAVHAVAQHVAGHLPIGAAQYAPRDADGTVTHARGTHLRSGDLTDMLIEQPDTMILAACGYMLAPLLAQLRAAGIPFHNPYRAKHGAWNPMRSAGRLAAYLRPRDDVWGNQARAWTWDDLRQWTEPLQASTALVRGAKTLIASKCETDRFGEGPANQEVPLDVLMDNILGTTDFQHPALRMDTAWWAEHLRAKEAKVARYPLEVLRKSGPAALRATPSLVVGTVHSTKGAEAARVILAPDLSIQGAGAWHDGGEARDSITRMAYVGVTRAREDLVILDPAGPDHIPASLFGEGMTAARPRGMDLEARIAARLAEKTAA